jgi:mycofactocin system glycosyltransferase
VRYRPDPSARLLPDGRTLIGGSPLRLFRLTAAGGGWFASLVGGADLPPPGPRADGSVPGADGPLLRRLLDAGVVHPVPEAVPHAGPGRPEGGEASPCTVVIPVRDRPGGLASLLDSIERADGVAQVVVVDDGSGDGPAHERVTRAAGATYLRLDRSRGPGAARDAGIRAARHEAVVVVDSDVEVTTGWLEPLLAHLADPVVAAVAARVRTGSGTGAVAAYEVRSSPLDLGPESAPVAPGTRVAYVPAAALLLRRSAYLEVGGFDPDLRFGEDVDLEWRFAEHGWSVRHEPASIVFHPARRTVGEFLRQRAEYGSSAAALDRRHPGAVAPWRASRWSLGVWLLVLTGHPVAAVLLAGGTAAALARRLADLPVDEAVGLVVRGHLGAGRSLARAVVRTWWPVAFLGALVSRRARRLVVAAVVVTAADRFVADGEHRSVRSLPLALLDDLAYGAGVWWGCWWHRRWGPLIPALDP